MLAKIVGDVNMYSAAVLISICFMFTVVGAIWFAKRRSKLEVNNELELAKIKQADYHAEMAFKLDTERGFKFKQIDAGLITSHKRRGSSDNDDD